jgi:hypothetical protein
MQRVLRVRGDSDVERASVFVDGQFAYRRLRPEGEACVPGKVIDVELKNGQWVQCRIDRAAEGLLWVTRLM